MTPDLTRRLLADFSREQGASALHLASHAALPVVLNSELVHLLRINYFLDPARDEPLSYNSEVALLLSPLCSEIDDGLYVVEPELRDALLRTLVVTYGPERVKEVALLLWEYTQRYAPWTDRPGLTEAQQLTALSFVAPERALEWLEQAEQQAGPGVATDRRWFVAMRRDLERVRRAVEMAAPAVGPQTVADAIAVGRLEDGLNLADHITDPIDRARVLAALASVILQAGREEDAGRVVDEIRRGIEGRLSGMEHVDLLIELAHALWMDPLPEASAKHGLLLKLLDAAAGASAKLGSPHDRATALIKLGEAYRQAGRIDRAERCNLDALELTRATKDLAGEAAVLDCLGLIYSERGQGKNATESYERALKLYQRVGNDEGKATVLEHLGEVQERLGNNRLAQTYYEQALSLLRQSGDRSGEAAMLGNIDRVNAKIGGKSNVSPTRQKPNEAYPIGKGEQFDRPSKSVASSTGSLIPRFFIVKEEERAVIYRRGRFHRIDGPGWVFLRPFETVQRMLLVRDQPRTASVAQLFLYGIPIGFTLSFWARVDPVAAAGGDAVRLKDMAMFEDYERDQQVDLKIRDSFVHRVSELEKNRPLSNHATIIDKIIPILPGSPECDWLLNQVRGDLTRTLPLVGVFLNTRHPITLNGIIAPKEMIEGFSRGRMQELLRLYFPKLPADRLAQMVESIEGLETMGRYDFDQKGSAAQQVVPDKKTGDDAGGMKVVRSSLLRLQLASAEPPAAESIPEELTKHDLSYLRSVPRAAAAKA